MSKNPRDRTAATLLDRLGLDIGKITDPAYVHGLAGKAEESQQQRIAAETAVKHAQTIGDNYAAIHQAETEIAKHGLRSVHEMDKQISQQVIAQGKFTADTEVLKTSTANKLGLISSEANHRIGNLNQKYQHELKLLATKYQALNQQIGADKQQSSESQYRSYLNGETNKNPYKPGLFSSVRNALVDMFS